jgi:hypothetical protein
LALGCRRSASPKLYRIAVTGPEPGNGAPLLQTVNPKTLKISV